MRERKRDWQGLGSPGRCNARGLKMGTLVATMPDARCYSVSAKTGWPA